MECRIFTDPSNGATYDELLESAKLAEQWISAPRWRCSRRAARCGVALPLAYWAAINRRKSQCARDGRAASP